MDKTSFNNIAEQLNDANLIIFHKDNEQPRFAMFSSIEDCDDSDGSITRFELVTSDGFDGYETLHEFHIKDNPHVLLFNNDAYALLQDIEGDGVHIGICQHSYFTK